MTVTYLGEKTIGGCLPIATAASASIGAAVAEALPSITGQLSGYESIIANPTSVIPDLVTQASLALEAIDEALAELALRPGGPALAAAYSAALAGMTAAQTAIDGAHSDLGLKLSAALGALQGLRAQLAAGVTGPSINLDLMLAEAANLAAAKAVLEEQLEVAVDIGQVAATAGVRLYRYDGSISLAGIELQAHLSAAGVTGDAHLVVMLPMTSSAWVGLQAAVAV